MGDLGYSIAARSFEGVGARIVVRLRARRSEIVQAIYTHIHAVVPALAGGQDPAYQRGVLVAVAAVLDHCLDAIEHGPGWSAPIPREAAVQARRAARLGVSMGTVLRRYVAAHGRLGEFIAEEAEHIDLSSNGHALQQHLRRAQEELLERLTAAIEQEYDDERERMERPSAERRAEIVCRLLAKEPVKSAELAELDYELHASWHLGMMTTGTWIQGALQRIKTDLGCEVLTAKDDDETTWAWIGASRRLELVGPERLVVDQASCPLALGGLWRGLDGWRQTHREARGALLRARRKPEKIVRYADGPLLSAALENDTLANWLMEFLTPLRDRPDGGTELLHALRAYIDAGCSYSSAAPMLNVRRQTVGSRVRLAEELLKRPLRKCLAELDAALSLLDLPPEGSFMR